MLCEAGESVYLLQVRCYGCAESHDWLDINRRHISLIQNHTLSPIFSLNQLLFPFTDMTRKDNSALTAPLVLPTTQSQVRSEVRELRPHQRRVHDRHSHSHHRLPHSTCSACPSQARRLSNGLYNPSATSTQILGQLWQNATPWQSLGCDNKMRAED